ncbi:hypothetical protein JG687_00009572 [Phytophthora cactorum]|uniref:Regulator of chromosome condensation 1/beta-lactamase-inhibitor protein II n=1 Tax=Phytophthora cactorum TaxID=29920 RepID=A0A8T1U996_9STRA|nr:hypothetical protein JG687_00009572 [Phytophthora cactorum]
MYMSYVACGEYHSLALSSDGRVFSWGCSTYGKLGRASDGERYVVRRIAAGKDHSLAISSDGAVFTWGRGDSGQLGHGCYMDVSEPKQVMAISAAISEKCGLIDIAGGNDFSIFLLQNGTAYICGRDPSLDIEKLHLSPSLLTLPSTLEGEFFGQIAAVSCGEAHYALLSKSGALLVSFSSLSQLSPDAGSATAEMQERRVEWVKEAGDVHRMVCGASHTLVVV